MMSTRRLAATWHGLVAVESRTGPGRAVVLSEVQPGSPAEMAGFRPGDQVVRVGDLTVTTPLDIERGLLDVAPGQKAQVRRPAWRPGPGAADSSPSPCPAPSPTPRDQVWRMLGLKTTPVSPEYVASASPKLRGGLYIQAVSPGSPGAHASIQKGDILVGMNVGIRHWETIRPDNILFILRQPEVAQSQTMQFYIVRRNGIHQGTMSLAELPASKVLSR